MIDLHAVYRLLAGGLFALAFGWVYFRLSRGAGKALFVLLLGGLSLVFWFSPLAHLLAFLGLSGLFAWDILRRRERRPAFQPARAIAEGGGVKRGLTAPEAAVLLEMPNHAVLAAVLIGLFKKGAIRLVEGPVARLEVAPDFRARQVSPDAMQRAAHRRAAAQRHNAILHPHEEPFLELLEENTGQELRSLNFTVPLRALQRETARRVGGYDLEATRTYYRKHLGRARHDAARSSESPAEDRLLAHHLEWLILDGAFAELYRGYRPAWLHLGDSKQDLVDWAAWLEQELASSDPAGRPHSPEMGGMISLRQQ
jgi:hypothetical protein